MKKYLLLLSLFCAFSTVHSQDLTNTEWLGTNFPSPNVWLHFGPDTIYYSMTGSGYSPLSLYTASSGQFIIVDLPGTTLCTDTGHYNYSVNGSNLIFSLVSDNCSSRKNTLLNYSWMQLATFISEAPRISEILVYPNPCNGILNITTSTVMQGKSEVTLFDISGKKVYDQFFEGDKVVIDISALPTGIYSGQFRTTSSVNTFIISR
ncbi:MAG: T9SS type A sorting domain-containing protein [Chitinophagales bacterium]